MDSELLVTEQISKEPPVCRRRYVSCSAARQRRIGLDHHSNERRSRHRYEIHLPVQYRVSQRGAMAIAGAGTTCDLSTGGLSFRCRRPLPVGAHIEISVEWPVLYGDTHAMELQVTGFVVRTEGSRVGVRVNSHRFRLLPSADQPYQVSA